MITSGSASCRMTPPPENAMAPRSTGSPDAERAPRLVAPSDWGAFHLGQRPDTVRPSA
jgi:hypothetical protein